MCLSFFFSTKQSIQIKKFPSLQMLPLEKNLIVRSSILKIEGKTLREVTSFEHISGALVRYPIVYLSLLRFLLVLLL